MLEGSLKESLKIARIRMNQIAAKYEAIHSTENFEDKCFTITECSKTQQKKEKSRINECGREDPKLMYNNDSIQSSGTQLFTTSYTQIDGKSILCTSHLQNKDGRGKIDFMKYLIEEELQSNLKDLLIQRMVSVILRNGKEKSYTIKCLKEIKRLRRAFSKADLKLYVKTVLPNIQSTDLCHKIEVDHKSCLKEYFEHWKSKPDSKKWLSLVRSEWCRLSQDLPENYLCRYYEITYGPIRPMQLNSGSD